MDKQKKFSVLFGRVFDATACLGWASIAVRGAEHAWNNPSDAFWAFGGAVASLVVALKFAAYLGRNRALAETTDA